MKLNNIRSISYLRANTGNVVRHVQETHDPVAITVHGKVQAIVQDPISFQKTQEQLTMLLILAHGRREIKEGKVIGHEELFAQLADEDMRSHK